MKILITGGNGFIGKNLIEKLNKKYTIVFPDRKMLDLLDESTVREYLRESQFDIIIHAANTNNTRNTMASPYSCLDGNIRMFFNLERCKEYYGKMYYFGSGAEYDIQHYIPAMDEVYFDTYVPKDSYGFSKYIMSKVCNEKNNIYDLRLFGVYGKYEEWEHRFISNAICRALKGKEITIQKNVYFDYMWIEDLGDIMEWFINNEPKHKHYNVCTGKKIDLYSLACLIKKILDIDCDIVIAKKGWKKEYSGNNSRLLKEIGNYLFTEYEKAVAELCDYYKSIIDVIDEEKLM